MDGFFDRRSIDRNRSAWLLYAPEPAAASSSSSDASDGSGGSDAEVRTVGGRSENGRRTVRGGPGASEPPDSSFKGSRHGSESSVTSDGTEDSESDAFASSGSVTREGTDGPPDTGSRSAAAASSAAGGEGAGEASLPASALFAPEASSAPGRVSGGSSSTSAPASLLRLGGGFSSASTSAFTGNSFSGFTGSTRSARRDEVSRYPIAWFMNHSPAASFPARFMPFARMRPWIFPSAWWRSPHTALVTLHRRSLSTRGVSVFAADDARPPTTGLSSNRFKSGSESCQKFSSGRWSCPTTPRIVPSASIHPLHLVSVSLNSSASRFSSSSPPPAPSPSFRTHSCSSPCAACDTTQPGGEDARYSIT